MTKIYIFIIANILRLLYNYYNRYYKGQFYYENEKKEERRSENAELL